MSSYVYIESEKPNNDNNHHSLYTVGFYDPTGQWHAESDHTDSEKAANRVNFLNGGSPLS